MLCPSCKTSFCPSFLVTCHLWMKYLFGDFDMTWSNPDDCSGQTFVNFSPSIILFCLFVLSVEIRLRLYGSSCTKFGFKDSDVNINIQYPPHVSSPVWVRWCFFIVFHSHTSIKKYFHWYYFTFVVLQDLRWLFCGCCICRTHHIHMSFFLYHIYVVWRLWNGMYSQMHQPDVLLLVKESLSVSRESPPICLATRFVFSWFKNSTLGKSVMSSCFHSSLRRSGSWFSCQGACGYLQREK